MNILQHSSPVVTIAIPAFNNASTIAQTVQSALEQTWADLEIIVSDDASTDDTNQILRKFTDSRLRVIRQPTNLGMANNFRFCLEQAQGLWITFLNADDYLLPASLEKRIALFQAYPDAVISCTDAQWQGVRQDAFLFPFGEYTAGHTVLQWSLCQAVNKIHWSAALLKTQQVRALGLSDNTFFDWVLWLRLMMSGGVAHSSDKLTILVDREQRVTKQRMKLRSKHCAELLGVYYEFEASCSALPAHLLRCLRAGKIRLLQIYSWLALMDYKLAPDKSRLIKERDSLLTLTREYWARWYIRILLSFPGFWIWLRKTKRKLFSCSTQTA